MKPSMEVDLSDIHDIFEGFVKRLDRMDVKDLIDLAARLKPVVKSCDEIDKHVKELVKAKLKHLDGEIKGNLFKACLALIGCDRLDQKKFKEEKPDIYAKYVRHDTDERVTYKAR